MRLVKFFGAALTGAAIFISAGAADAANPRIALVIGESAYPDAALPTAANDAGLVAQVLQAAGFDVVGARDLDQKSVRELLRDFLDKANAAGPDMQAFVYLSGRALQYAGDNYLAPIDARIARDSDTPLEAVKISDFTHALAAAPGLARVVVIDGARPNPYAQTGAPLAGGLALVDPEANTLVAFNAAPGSIGVEDAGDYGVYAKTLAGLMRQGGVDVSEILAETRIEVNQQTQGAQIPWSAGKLDAPYFLFERAANAPPPKRIVASKKPLKQLSAQEAYEVVIERDNLGDYEAFLRDHARSEQARRISAIVAARREATFWRRALDANDPRGYWTYLRRYPRGPHAFDAGRRLDTLAARREPPPDFAVMEYEDLPPPPPDEAIYADRPVYYFGGDDFGPPPPRPPRGYYVEEDDGWRDLPPPPPPTVAGILPALAVAIPLMITARAFHDRPDRDGRAPASAPPLGQRPMGPPPLPGGVRVTAAPAPATPAPVRAPAAGGAGQVKFAAPPKTMPGARPPAPGTAPAPAATPAVAPATPAPARTPLPTPAAAPATPAATPAPSRTPLPTPAATPATPAATATPARTPLPTPAATPATPAVTPAPARTPLPTPAATPATPAVTPAPARTPLPTPAATPATPSPPPLRRGRRCRRLPLALPRRARRCRRPPQRRQFRGRRCLRRPRRRSSPSRRRRRRSPRTTRRLRPNRAPEKSAVATRPSQQPKQPRRNPSSQRPARRPRPRPRRRNRRLPGRSQLRRRKRRVLRRPRPKRPRRRRRAPSRPSPSRPKPRRLSQSRPSRPPPVATPASRTADLTARLGRAD